MGLNKLIISNNVRQKLSEYQQNCKFLISEWYPPLIDSDHSKQQWVKMHNSGQCFIHIQIRNFFINYGDQTWKEECECGLEGGIFQSGKFIHIFTLWQIQLFCCFFFIFFRFAMYLDVIEIIHIVFKSSTRFRCIDLKFNLVFFVWSLKRILYILNK